MTRNSNALMRDEFVLAESDLADFLSGSTDSAINFSGSADLHTPIHPPRCGLSAKRGSLVRVPVENHALRLCLNVNGAQNTV